MYTSGFGGFSSFDRFMFGGGADIVFLLVAGLVIGLFIAILVSGAGQWHKNNNSPQLTVDASVVSRRTQVSGGSGDTMASTWYYATFQVESGDRMEFSVSGPEYGLLAEGDAGRLTFQGTRFPGFERQ